MKSFLTVRRLLLVALLLPLGAALHYALPQVDVVRAVGVEIKRIDNADADASQPRTRDVYQIQTETLDGDPKVYRNEDNLFYLKFDSADLQAQIQSLSAEQEVVALRHYGWRIPLFSAFPNAVKVWPVEEGYRHIPVFNILVLIGLGALLFYVYRRAARAVDQSRRALENRRAEREAAAARKTQPQLDREREASREEQDKISAFINTDGDKKS